MNQQNLKQALSALSDLKKKTTAEDAKAPEAAPREGTSDQPQHTVVKPTDIVLGTDADLAQELLIQITSVLNPEVDHRSFVDTGFKWGTDRAKHPHHAAAHVVGQLIGHIVTLGSTALGKRLPHHPRRVFAHLLHGIAHSVHPGNN